MILNGCWLVMLVSRPPRSKTLSKGGHLAAAQDGQAAKPDGVVVEAQLSLVNGESSKSQRASGVENETSDNASLRDSSKKES